MGINIPCYIDNENQISGATPNKDSVLVDNTIILLSWMQMTDWWPGIINDNKISYGNDCVAGEIGHMLIDPADDIQCFCGGYGCLENKVSATGVARIYSKLKKQHTESTPIQHSARIRKDRYRHITARSG